MVVMVTMSQAAFKETFHKLLLSLAVTDSIFILCAVFAVILRALELLETESSSGLLILTRKIQFSHVFTMFQKLSIF